MSVLYDEENTGWNVSKTINVSDCMKLSKKLSVNNEPIAKLIKVKEHTKLWIKNVEKASKLRSVSLNYPVVHHDRMYASSFSSAPPVATAAVKADASCPSMYPPVLPVSYSCSFCKAPTAAGVAQYHETLSRPYVMLCTACSNKER